MQRKEMMWRKKWPHLRLLGSWPVVWSQHSAGGTLLTSNELQRRGPAQVAMSVDHRQAVAIFPFVFLPFVFDLRKEQSSANICTEKRSWKGSAAPMGAVLVHSLSNDDLAFILGSFVLPKGTHRQFKFFCLFPCLHPCRKRKLPPILRS